MDRLLLAAEQVAVGIDGATGTVDVALYQQSEYRIQHTILSLNLFIGSIDGVGNGLGDAYLIHMGVVDERFLDILHV